ncbi:tail collar domain [Pseudomonas poae]|uniref:Tail collar domain n=1 Tax=Pseudomonas poae TaxID=200451 RepID=A0A7Z1K1G1_9PSED|nr:phage tail protein [Pseudomonas poae]PFG59325.1 tail collar domain [Pseudomonas poae]
MADYYTLLTNAGIAYETACKAAGVPIKLAQISVGDGNGAVYNPDANAKALKREVWRGPLNALFQDEKNANWLMAEVTIPSDVGGWYVREAGLWTDTGILYAVVKYPESYKPVLATSGSGKEFYIRSIFETSNASIVTLLIDDTVVKATRAWVMDYLAKGTYSKAEIEAMIAKASALPVGSVIAFPVDKIPPGFFELDGSVKSAAAYPDLSSFLGSAFNKGDEGAGNFRLPESRGEFLRGWDHGRGVDPGRVIGSGQAQSVQKHDHAMWSGGSYGSTNPAGGGAAAAWVNGAVSDMRTGITGSDETRPRNLAVIWCIKAWSAPINQGSIDIAALALLVSQATEVKQGTAKVGTQPQVNAGVNDEVIVTPKKLRLGFAASLTANGYLMFPSWLGGLTIQWGSVTSSAAALSFPIAFATNCTYLGATVNVDANSGGGGTEYMTMGTVISNTQFKMRTGTVNGVPVRWLAVGY